MLRRLGLRQRLMTILAAAGLVTIFVVGLSLYELAALQSLSQAQRAADRRGEAVQDTAMVALQVATAFSSLSLDLNETERQQALGEGDAMLALLEQAVAGIDGILNQRLSAEDKKSIDDALGAIRRAWKEITEETKNAERAELLFHLFGVMQKTNELRRYLFIVKEITRGEALRAEAAVDERVARARWPHGRCLVDLSFRRQAAVERGHRGRFAHRGGRPRHARDAGEDRG
jgi:hypothetical protein